jgi:hypothetical protein
MCTLRVHRHAQIAQSDSDPVKGEGHRPERLVELDPVIRGLGCGKGRELVTGRPVELARIDDAAPGYGAIAGQILGRRMHNDRGTMFDRTAQVRRGRSVIDDKRQTRCIRHRRNGGKVGDVTAGIGDRFAEDGARIAVDGHLERVDIVKIHELCRPAEFPDRVGKLLDRAAVELGRGHHIPSGGHQGEKRHDLRCMAGRTADSANATFKRGDPFRQNANRRVRQARIDIANFLQVEERGCMIRVTKDISRRLIDRRLPCPCCGVRLCAGMNLQRVEA